MSRLKIGSFEADGRTVSVCEKRSIITDSSGSYRDVNGVMHENILGVKVVLDFTADMLTGEQAAALRSQLSASEVTAVYAVPDEKTGVFRTISETTEFSCADGNGVLWRIRAVLEKSQPDEGFG